jgi:hypothetical protein
MVARKPLVIITGQQQELPAADILAPGAALTTTQRDALASPATGQPIYNTTTAQYEYYDGTTWRNYAGEPSVTVAQLQGFSTGNIAEVEGTKALRVSYRSLGCVPNFTLSRHSVGSDIQGQNATTAAGVDQIFFIGGWFNAGVAIIRQVRASLWTSALSGTRNGTCNMKLFKTDSLNSTSTGNLLTPDSSRSPGPGNNSYTKGLHGQQIPAMLNLSLGPNMGLGAGSDIVEVEPLGAIYGECKNAIGTHISNQILYDSRSAETPLHLMRFMGFYVTLSYPAAVTSQTINAQFNVRWDEHVPAPFIE